MKIGFYQFYWGQIGGGQRYTGLAAQYLSEIYDVEFLHHCAEFDRSRIEEALELDLSRVRFRFVPEPQRPASTTRNPVSRLAAERRWCREFSEPYDLFFNNSDHIPIHSHARCGVLLTHFPLVTYDEFNGRTNGRWSSQSLPSRWARQAFQRLEWQQRFATYDKFIVNSGYGRRWIKNRWGVEAQVLYPPLRRSLACVEKEPLILTVGAFHESQHKRQDVLIDSFKAMVDSGLGGWQYVLVGGTNGSRESLDYVNRLRAAAVGYPIDIRTNAPGDELSTAFQRASILWHAMGYGLDERNEPEKFEHFGMVATEAMAAGCVPIVFNGGGLREIVTSGRDGFLWNSLDELQACTSRVIADNELRQSLARAAVDRSKHFSNEAFRERLLQILGPLLN